MNPLLNKALSKFGIKSFNDLNDLEKATFKQWEQVLDRKKITQDEVIDDIKEYSDKLLEQIFDKQYTDKQKTYLLSQLEVVKYILRLLDQPKTDVKRVEQEIENLN